MALYRVNTNAIPMIYNSYKLCVNITKSDLPRRQSTVKNGQFLLKYTSTKKTVGKKINLQNYIAMRRSEALRSIIVQVASINSCKDLLLYCSNLGKVEKAYYYTLPKDHQFVLLEFKDLQTIENIYKNAALLDRETYIPSRTNVLWFRKIPINKINTRYNNNLLPKVNVCDPLLLKEDAIRDAIASSFSISDQMVTLYNEYKLTELEIRLKFQTIVQLEKCFNGLFPYVIIHPFGSFINGYGKRLSDLDLILVTDGLKKENLTSRLVYHAKSTNIDEKQQTHALMGVLADSMKYIIPGIVNVRKIFNAKVPIIKFKNFFTHTDCDLSMSNTIAIYMSELLFLFGEIDNRVRPLVFTIRKWAEDNKLTSIHPGKTITNFSLTLLVIFYLQQVNVLPTINSIKTFSKIKDGDQNNVRNIYTLYSSDYIKSDTKNNAELSTLLIDFFKFYATFNFDTEKICLQSGNAVHSMHNAALFIRNPFEEELNVSKNVSFNEVQRMRSLMLIAITNIENTKSLKIRKWGILSILNFPEATNLSINISQIFDKTTDMNTAQNNRETESVQKNDVSNSLSTETNDVITNKNVM